MTARRSADIRVLVVDDSPFVCRLLASHLQSDPEIEVVGTAHHGRRALEMVRALRPSAVTLDLEMPGMPGLAVLDEVMRSVPTPVVIVSGVSRRSAEITLEALQRGAVDFVLKYSPGLDTDPDQFRDDLVAKVRQSARLRMIRSLSSRVEAATRARSAASRPLDPVAEGAPGPAAGVVVVGASTGGPPALLALLDRLPASFPAAILVVQHMPAAFTRALAEQLDRHVALAVKEAQHGDPLLPGHVLVAPGDRHLQVTRQGRACVDDGPKVGGHRPAIDVTMASAAHAYGRRCMGVVLTGMGEDGAAGLEAIRRAGGRTFAQDPASCVVNGMPQQAVDRGVVDLVATPAAIALQLCVSLSAKTTAGSRFAGALEELPR